MVFVHAVGSVKQYDGLFTSTCLESKYRCYRLDFISQIVTQTYVHTYIRTYMDFFFDDSCQLNMTLSCSAILRPYVRTYVCN